MSRINPDRAGHVGGPERVVPARPASGPAATPKETKGASRSGDTVSGALGIGLASLAARAERLSRADRDTSKLEGVVARVGELLNELKSTIGVARDGGQGNLGEVQSRLDAIANTIRSASDSAKGAGAGEVLALTSGVIPPTPLFPSSFSLTNVNSGVVKATGRADIAVGGSVDVNVAVLASAQQAGFYLSFGQFNLNLGGSGASDGADDVFQLEIRGSVGTQVLSFASGTTLRDITDAINSFTDLTGVSAKSSGTGIALGSAVFGSEEFVSVRVQNDGSINTAQAQAGIYELQTFNANAAKRSTSSDDRTLFSSAEGSLLTDTGRDLIAEVNGRTVFGRGSSLFLNTNELSYKFSLATGNAAGLNAQRIGSSGLAFTITRPAAASDGGSVVEAGPEFRVDLERVSKLAGGAASIFERDAQESDRRVGTAIDVNEANRAALAGFRASVLGREFESLRQSATLPAGGSAPLNAARVRDLLLGNG